MNVGLLKNALPNNGKYMTFGALGVLKNPQSPLVTDLNNEVYWRLIIYHINEFTQLLRVFAEAVSCIYKCVNNRCSL